MPKSKKPEWTPANAGSEFTTTVMPGVESVHDGLPSKSNSLGDRDLQSNPLGDRALRPVKHPKKLTINDYIAGILNRDTMILARAITLVESNSHTHQVLAQELIRNILPKAGNSIRIAITGVPGAGKSTFIETFGSYLTSQGHNVAVLAVDPSSSITHGSILGDKTRMERLARDPHCFIRPSPSGGTLGGVTKKTRETMLLCEAAGYDVILVETVGVGQSEITVRSMVDFFLLLQIPGAGDELQGIKKGVIELADAIVVNKADGDNIQSAKRACSEYAHALHYLTPATIGWKTDAYTCSALTEEGIPEIWALIENFKEVTKKNGFFLKRRNSQVLDWVKSMIQEYLEASFYQNPGIKTSLPDVQKQLLNGDITASMAVEKLITIFQEKL